MLDRNLVVDKMRERGFTVWATASDNKIVFLTEVDFNADPRLRKPVINITVDLNNGHFKCAYNIKFSINSIISPECSPVMDDDQFDKIVSKFESHAKWMEKLTG